MSELEFDLGNEIDVAAKAVEQKQAVVKYNEKVEQLSDKIVYHMQNKTAVSEQVVEILIPFLEVAVEMQAIIEVITEINSVVDLIGEAIGLIDGTMNQNQSFLTEQSTVKLGWFAKIKRKLQQKALITANKRRAEDIADRLVCQYEIAMGLAGSFKEIPDRLNRAMGKAKKNNRTGGGNKSAGGNYQMSDGLRKILTDKGADLGTSSSPSTGGGISDGL